MKKVYASRNLARCDVVRSLLDAAGIPSMLKNELVWWTPGARIVGLLPFAWPEVWVNDSDWDTASEVLQDIDFDE